MRWRQGYGVATTPFPFLTKTTQVLTIRVHYWCMGRTSITGWVCEVCGYVWSSRTDSKPLRCAGCKSPYWDKGNRDAESSGSSSNVPALLPAGKERVDNHSPIRTNGVDDRLLGHNRKQAEDALAIRASERGGSSSETEEELMCSYKEYDGESGEWYGCSLKAHSSKVRHVRGGKL